MGLARYLVEAVVLEGRSVTELARGHGVSRFWIYKLLARYRQGGYPALEPRSRRPRSGSHQTAPEVEAEVVRVREELSQTGFDAGPQTILHHLQGRVPKLPSAATIWRILKRRGLITPQPHKRPRAQSLAELQVQLDTFRLYYNHHRPHRALGRRTPEAAFNARLKARPESRRRPLITGFAATASTPRARSPCATWAASATSRSGPSTATARSISWLPAPTSAS
jgi:transposase